MRARVTPVTDPAPPPAPTPAQTVGYSMYGWMWRCVCARAWTRLGVIVYVFAGSVRLPGCVRSRAVCARHVPQHSAP